MLALRILGAIGAIAFLALAMVRYRRRQISRLSEVMAYAGAGVDVLKLQGRSLPPDLLSSLVRRYRDAIDDRIQPIPHQPALPAGWAVVGR